MYFYNKINISYLSYCSFIHVCEIIFKILLFLTNNSSIWKSKSYLNHNRM